MTDAVEHQEEGPRSGYQVKTHLFEGPLDLLLYLVSKQKLDITEMSLAKVAEEYWAYLKMLQTLDLDVESSYLVVFACLLELKSRLLLPPEPEPPDEMDFDLGDTAEFDLVERLKEYKKYKEASLVLQEREREAMQVFPRPIDEEEAIEPPTLDVSLPDLLEALRGVLESYQKRSKKKEGLTMERVAVSVPQRMREIVSFLRPDKTFQFTELFEGEATRDQIIVTFLAILELTRLARIRIWQEVTSGPIFVERAEDVSSRELLLEELMLLEEGGASPGKKRRRGTGPPRKPPRSEDVESLPLPSLEMDKPREEEPV
ncbi:MAG: segregation/condensation protein A [Armatimonadetes bacterium]|nr:segregation/condensation protein A [Armatimonadota bacterium]